ncbi:Holliday junction branch migration protein RuvA [Anthocerotibacter panamensis]|uniref:Holliday junction branch migration protein RuvA n=1 Tax=Anthocerotibacter panamensis TaxID=2857077 RepID=UPI001C4068B9|nr:Holliday junction branch migration protein RuvA [Anthocerotibacter panamensis]
MIFAVAGTLAQVSPEWVVIETLGGVSYQIGVHKRLQPPAVGAPLKLWTYHLIREEQVLLYGFADLGEREVFAQLLAVSGVGPRLALALLETFGAAELVHTILKGNSRALALTPGVGPKTAQRIILELQSRLEKWQERTGGVATGGVPLANEEVQLALLALGYTPQQIKAALSQAKLEPDAPIEQWIRACISFLSRS